MDGEAKKLINGIRTSLNDVSTARKEKDWVVFGAEVDGLVELVHKLHALANKE